MRTSKLPLLSLALLFAVPGLANAQEPADDLGVTMSVIEDTESADEGDFVNEIELPETPADEARSNAQGGSDSASQARQQGSENRNERAREGRDRRPENGNRGGDGRPDNPGGGQRPDDVPGR